MTAHSLFALAALGRSEWVSPEGGSRTTRQELEKLAGFRAQSVSEVSLGRELAREGETVVVELDASIFVGSKRTRRGAR